MNTVLDILVQIWLVLCQMAPYLLFGFFMAGLLSILISPTLVERHLGGGGLWPVLKAALIGVPLPLCSCGVIPVSASLRRHGASRASTISFLISTPETGVDSVVVTYSLLGGVFAVARVIVAFVSGVVGGTLVALLGGPEKVSSRGAGVSPASGNAQPHGHGAHATHGQDAHATGEQCVGGCCAPAGRRERLVDKIIRMTRYGFMDLPQDIGKSLLIGLGVAALITIIPQDFFPTHLGFLWKDKAGQMLLMMLIGIPMYVCATASVPMAMALMMQGISPGAAMVFLMVGPATNAATIAMIWQVMGRRTAIIYVCSVAMVALAAGTMMNTIFPTAGPGAMAMTHDHQHMMEHVAPWQHAAAVVLLAVLLMALVRRYILPKHHVAVPQDLLTNGDATETTMTTQTLKVTGMTCSHCVATVKRTLLEAPGVTSAEVDLASGLATVQGKDLDLADLRQRVTQLGYQAA